MKTRRSISTLLPAYGFKSAAGAALSSRGRQAVDQGQREELRAERAGIVSAVRELRFNVAPSALGIRFTLSPTALRPWLFNAGPADLCYVADSVAKRVIVSW